MEDWITRPIGEKFDCNGVPLEVVEEGEVACEGCYFRHPQFCCHCDIMAIIGLCSAIERDDEKDVIFKEVE